MRMLTLCFVVAMALWKAEFAWATTDQGGEESLTASRYKIAIVSSRHNQPAGTSSKEECVNLGKDERVSLPQLAREAIAVHFHASKYTSLESLIRQTPVCAEYRRTCGLFVTLSKNGKTRACWGSIHPQNQDLVSATVHNTESALTKEYRYPRIRPNEWQLLKPQVTVIRGIEPISSIRDQNALRYGLLVRYGGRGAVLLPGEASDAHYQLVKCKLKAGIPVDQPCQLYRLQADVFK
jgi:AMMECR1 domain-containing protein